MCPFCPFMHTPRITNRLVPLKQREIMAGQVASTSSAGAKVHDKLNIKVGFWTAYVPGGRHPDSSLDTILPPDESPPAPTYGLPLIPCQRISCDFERTRKVQIPCHLPLSINFTCVARSKDPLCSDSQS